MCAWLSQAGADVLDVPSESLLNYTERCFPIPVGYILGCFLAVFFLLYSLDSELSPLASALIEESRSLAVDCAGLSEYDCAAQSGCGWKAASRDWSAPICTPLC